MSEFVKQTMLGGYKAVPGGHSDPDCSHVILTKKEYDRQLREIAAAEQEERKTKSEAERNIQNMWSNARNQIADAESAAARKVADLEKELTAAKAEISFQRGLNTNLLRISKERANADRKLKPKKEHTGYVVTSSMEKAHRYKGGNDRRMSSVVLWETVLQTPYSVDFEEAEVRQLIGELFKDEGDGKWLILKIGITGKYLTGYEKMIRDKNWREVYPDRNVVVDIRLRANYRAGFWDLIFMHTKPLATVPADMRVR